MRIIDADILSYGLLENHITTQYTKPIIEKGIKGEMKLYVTITTLLEAYNTLYWHYKIRPRIMVTRKIRLVADSLILIPPSSDGFKICIDEDIPLGDAILIATALENKIPIIVSNDEHIERLIGKYGLIYENPIPKEVRLRMK